MSVKTIGLKADEHEIKKLLAILESLTILDNLRARKMYYMNIYIPRFL